MSRWFCVIKYLDGTGINPPSHCLPLPFKLIVAFNQIFNPLNERMKVLGVQLVEDEDATLNGVAFDCLLNLLRGAGK